MSALNVFISYSHKDEQYRAELESHLSLLQRQKMIKCWSDRQITAGDEWKGRINKNLLNADIIVMLISADFFASKICYDVEMKAALEAYKSGKSIVIPVIVRTVAWEGSPLGELQALPTNAKPVKSWEDRDDAWNDVRRGILKAIQTKRQEKKKVASDIQVDWKAVLKKFSKVRSDSKVAQTQGDQESIDDNLILLAKSHPDIERKIAGFRFKQKLDRVNQKRIVTEILALVNSGGTEQALIIGVMILLAERNQEKFDLLVEELTVVESIEEAGLSPTDYGFESAVEVCEKLNTHMEGQN